MNVQHLGVSEDVRRAAEELTENEAASLLPAIPGRSPPKKRRAGRRSKRCRWRPPPLRFSRFIAPCGGGRSWA